MKRLLLPLAAVAIAGLLLPTSGRPAYACSCALLSAEEYVSGADAVVIGTVSRLIDGTERLPAAPEKSEGADFASIPDTDAVVTVERYLKGAGPAEIEVDDPPSGGTCGFFDEASLGQRYLLFLTGEASPFQTHLCSGSTMLVEGEFSQERLQEVQAITGPGVLPPTGSAPAEEEPGSDVPWFVIAGASALGASALVAASVFVLRRSLKRG